MNRSMRRLAVIGLGAIALVSLGHLAGDRFGTSAVAQQPASVPRVIADSRAVVELAAHLKKVGAKMYGAYWCPHCKHQKDLFGDSAFRMITYIECDPRGENAKPEQCKAAKIKGYPTWEIKGKQYEGTQSLAELAKASGYTGKSKF